MKKVLILAFFMLFAQVFAHGLLMLAEDNGDGTVYIEAGYSGGRPAAGATVVLRETESGRTVFTGELGDDGRINVEQPSVAYTITVSIDEAHTVTRRGPLPKANRRQQ